MSAAPARFWQIEVEVRHGVPDPEGDGAAASLEATAVRSRRGYLLHGSISRAQAERAARELLADPVSDRFRLRGTDEPPFPTPAGRRRIDVLRKPGVMDPVAGSVERALATLGIRVPRVATFRSFEVETEASATALRNRAARVLANETIEELLVDRSDLPLPFEPDPAEFRKIVVPIRELDGDALVEMSRARSLSLSRLEMETIRDHYREQRRDPTDAEIETLAQTWSEHCKHKTLRGPCDYVEDGKPARRISSILGETIVAATERVRKPWCLSVFVDNAGVIEFDESLAVCFKVETHNHPSAIEPYGGAGTGIGGVIRDVLGTGLGAKPIASSDVFCVGPLDLPDAELPKGTLHPRRVLRGVVAGVRDYGNRMGIPTVSGGVYVDAGYVANPLVFCGTVGLLPRAAVRKEVLPGDAIVLLGGRTGRDGIHGATFSSVELHEESQTVSATAVQIGDPITEKKTVEAILRARDEGLLRSITDCGAGGLSSAVGELAAECGAEVELSRVPLKYAGLRYDEIWISEAQERMVVALAPANVARLREICAEEDVEATDLGRFDDSGRLRLLFRGEVVGDLDLRFLHKGVPKVVRRAEWSRPPKRERSEPVPAGELAASLRAILASPNVASKEWILRRYDHEVQGTTVVKPLIGPRRDGPSDAAVVAPVLGGRRGVALALGLNPRYGLLDPASLAESAIDEALRNVTAVGGDPDRTAILDNYCWGNCDKPDRLGSLVRASEAARDLAIAYETPFISGKDSLNNEYRVGDESISIPPTFLVSAISVVEDVSRCVTADLKKAGNLLILVGSTRDELGGSHLHLVRGLDGGDAPRVDAALGRSVLRGVARAIREGLVRSCHDLSEGGLAVAAAEMAFSGGLGVTIDASLVPLGLATPDRLDVRLFSESNSRFLVEILPSDLTRLRAALVGIPLAPLGEVTAAPDLVVRAGSETLFSIPIEECRRAFVGGYASTAGSGVP